MEFPGSPGVPASHDTEKVALFFLESFTFQVLDPTVVVRLDFAAK